MSREACSLISVSCSVESPPEATRSTHAGGVKRVRRRCIANLARYAWQLQRIFVASVGWETYALPVEPMEKKKIMLPTFANEKRFLYRSEFFTPFSKVGLLTCIFDDSWSQQPAVNSRFLAFPEGEPLHNCLSQNGSPTPRFSRCDRRLKMVILFQ